MPSIQYKTKTKEQQADIQQKYYRDKAQDVKDTDAERKSDERDSKRKKLERGIEV